MDSERKEGSAISPVLQPERLETCTGSSRISAIGSLDSDFRDPMQEFKEFLPQEGTVKQFQEQGVRCEEPVIRHVETALE